MVKKPMCKCLMDFGLLTYVRPEKKSQKIKLLKTILNHSINFPLPQLALNTK